MPARTSNENSPAPGPSQPSLRSQRCNKAHRPCAACGDCGAWLVCRRPHSLSSRSIDPQAPTRAARHITEHHLASSPSQPASQTSTLHTRLQTSTSSHPREQSCFARVNCLSLLYSLSLTNKLLLEQHQSPSERSSPLRHVTTTQQQASLSRSRFFAA